MHFNFFCKLKKTFGNLPVADGQVYEHTVEVFLNVFMQIKKMNFCLLIACGISQVLRAQRTIQPQVMTSSGPFPLVSILV